MTSLSFCQSNAKSCEQGQNPQNLEIDKCKLNGSLLQGCCWVCIERVVGPKAELPMRHVDLCNILHDCLGGIHLGNVLIVMHYISTPILGKYKSRTT
jgi:hypothetical protein